MTKYMNKFYPEISTRYKKYLEIKQVAYSGSAPMSINDTINAKNSISDEDSKFILEFDTQLETFYTELRVALVSYLSGTNKDHLEKEKLNFFESYPEFVFIKKSIAEMFGYQN